MIGFLTLSPGRRVEELSALDDDQMRRRVHAPRERARRNQHLRAGRRVRFRITPIRPARRCARAPAPRIRHDDELAPPGHASIHAGLRRGHRLGARTRTPRLGPHLDLAAHKEVLHERAVGLAQAGVVQADAELQRVAQVGVLRAARAPVAPAAWAGGIRMPRGAELGRFCERVASALRREQAQAIGAAGALYIPVVYP